MNEQTFTITVTIGTPDGMKEPDTFDLTQWLSDLFGVPEGDLWGVTDFEVAHRVT